MQVSLKRAGVIAQMTAIGTPDEIADLIRLTGAFGMEWRPEPKNGSLVAFGIADEPSPPEGDDARH